MNARGDMVEAMKAAEPPPREHDRAWDCWCNPRLFEACPECEPFGVIPEGHVHPSLWQAIAVQVPLHGVTAQRPKKAKGCWKCGGDGIRELTHEECPYRGKDAPQVAVLHQAPPPPKKTDPENS